MNTYITNNINEFWSRCVTFLLLGGIIGIGGIAGWYFFAPAPPKQSDLELNTNLSDICLNCVEIENLTVRGVPSRSVCGGRHISTNIGVVFWNVSGYQRNSFSYLQCNVSTDECYSQTLEILNNSLPRCKEIIPKS